MENIDYGAVTVLTKIIERIELDSVTSQIQGFDIRPGMTVACYSWGDGRDFLELSKMVGKSGEVVAITTNQRDIRTLNKIVGKSNLMNVEMSLATEYDCLLPNETADVIIVSDLLHKSRRPGLILQELRRLSKKTGMLYVDLDSSGVEETVRKIEESSGWSVVSKHKTFLVCA